MADPRGELRRIDDPQAEMERLAFQRQVTAAQICAAVDLCRDADHEAGPGHCVNWHAFRRSHDPAHCDRMWAAKEARDG